jgi:hypothetical protein
MNTVGSPFEEHQHGDEQAADTTRSDETTQSGEPGETEGPGGSRPPLLAAADRLLRRSLFSELTAVGEALRRLASSPQTWSPEGAAELYEQRAGLWRDLGPLVPRSEEALFLAVIVAEGADANRAGNLRDVAERIRRVS